MEIRVYRPDLFREGQIDNYSSLIWTRRFYEPGECELHAPLTDVNLSLLLPGNIIAKRGSLEAAVIEDIEIDEGVDGNKIIAKGRFLSSYMERRLIKSTINFSGKTEAAMRKILSEATPIPLVGLGNLNGFTDVVRFQATMKNLMAYETKLSKDSNIGYRFRPDFKSHRILFETYKGKDRTVGQSKELQVIFSEKYNNLNNVTYRYNEQGLRTMAIVGGQGEGAERIYYTLGGGTGLGLREIFVDAKDVSMEGLTEEEYKESLLQRAREKLNESIVSESLECETEPEVNFKYKEDYDLGDIVTIKKKRWGIFMNRRITEVKEIYENGGLCIVPTLGDPLPEKIDWSE